MCIQLIAQNHVLKLATYTIIPIKSCNEKEQILYLIIL